MVIIYFLFFCLVRMDYSWYNCSNFLFRSLFEVITIPIISLTSIVEKQELGLFRRLSEIIVTVLAFILGAYFDNYIYTFIMYSIFNSIVICMISYKLINHVDIKLISFYKKIKFYLMILSIVICLCFLYKLFASNSIILFFMFLSVLTFFLLWNCCSS